MGDDSLLFRPDVPEDARQGEVIVGAGLPEHSVVDAASAQAAKLIGEHEVLENVALGDPEPYGEGGAQVRQPFSYWVRTGP
jgi:hypothetical protein